MNKRALLGLFTLIALVTLGSVYVVLSDAISKSRGYRIGVRFPTAAGLGAGALVYESGVVIGTVDTVSVLPDYTSEVVLAIYEGTEIPSNARFFIAQPLQGDPTLRIILHSVDGSKGFAPTAPLPHEILPVARQPIGQAALSLPEFLAEGQTQFNRIDNLLAQFEGRAPQLLASLQQTLDGSQKLTRDADRSLLQLSQAANSSLSTLNSSSRLLTAQLSQSLAIASANLIDVTARLDQSTKSGQPHIEHMLTQLDTAASQLSQSIDALHGIAADPNLHENVISTTRSIAETAATFSSLLGDLRKVTGNDRTQAQLRDVVSHIDAASQKADSLLGALGGKSNVDGVDRAADPTSGLRPAPLPLATPLLIPTAPQPTAAAPVRLRPAKLISSVIGVQVRLGELSPQHRDMNGMPLSNRLLGVDRGPQTDVALVAFPHGGTSFILGANDIGYNSTLTLAAVRHMGAATIGGGILYSTLGVTAGLDGKAAGITTNIYDPRRGIVDVYGRIFANGSHNAAVFAGQRDITHDARRNVFGVQFSF